MKTYVLTCQKGGVGKTTTCLALAEGLVNRGYKVLAIDTDSQCNLTNNLKIDILQCKYTLDDVLSGKCKTEEAIQQTIKTGLDILPGSLELTQADMKYTGIDREYLLLEALKNVRGSYDACVIDTSPFMGVMTRNAMTAADYVVVPVTADIFTLQGLVQLQGILNTVKQYTNHNLTVSGLLVCRYNGRINATQAVMASMQSYADLLETKIFKARISETVAVRESQITQSLISDYSKNKAAQDYEAFIDELLEESGVN